MFYARQSSASHKDQEENQMSQESQPGDLANKGVVVQLPAMEEVTLQRDVVYERAGDEPLTLDIYRPPNPAEHALPPVLLFVTGYPDAGFRKFFGYRQKEMQSYVTWGKLAAASGLAAVCYSNREPARDALAALRFVTSNAASLGLDGRRIGIWSCSGSVPTALSILTGVGRETVKCASLAYGCMLDLDGSEVVSGLARQFGFANACAGKTVADLPVDLPLLVVRAGRDTFPGLNGTIDRFVGHALAANLPLTLINHANGPHAFDVFQESEDSREIVRRMLGFLRFHLGGPAAAAS